MIAILCSSQNTFIEDGYDDFSLFSIHHIFIFIIFLVAEEEGFVSMTAGHTTVKVKKGTDGWDVSFSRDGKRLTGGGWRSTSYIQENKFHRDARLAVQTDDDFFNYPQDAHNTFIREQLKALGAFAGMADTSQVALF